MKKTFFASLISLISFSCMSQQDQGPKPTKDPTVYKGVTDKSCAVEMAFGSYGSGIDGPAITKTMDLIKEYNQPYTSKSIGREGETRICMPLANLKGKKRTAFIKRLKKIAKEGQLVSVSIR
jgi:hypothetical protein